MSISASQAVCVGPGGCCCPGASTPATCPRSHTGLAAGGAIVTSEIEALEGPGLCDSQAPRNPQGPPPAAAPRARSPRLRPGMPPAAQSHGSWARRSPRPLAAGRHRSGGKKHCAPVLTGPPVSDTSGLQVHLRRADQSSCPAWLSSSGGPSRPVLVPQECPGCPCRPAGCTRPPKPGLCPTLSRTISRPE